MGSEEIDQEGGAAEAPKMVQLKLQGEGLSLDREIPEPLALEILAVVMGGQPPAASPRGGQGPPRRQSLGQTSLREYLDDVEATRNPEKIVAMGNFIKQNTGQETFTREEVKGKFRSAGERTPSNFARDFAVTMAGGWIAEDPNSGEFYVTNRGLEALDQHFSSEARRAVTQARRARRRPRRGQPSTDE